MGITNDEEIAFNVSTKEGKIIPVVMKLNEEYEVEVTPLEANDSSTVVIDEIPIADLEVCETIFFLLLSPVNAFIYIIVLYPHRKRREFMR